MKHLLSYLPKGSINSFPHSYCKDEMKWPSKACGYYCFLTYYSHSTSFRQSRGLSPYSAYNLLKETDSIIYKINPKKTVMDNILDKAIGEVHHAMKIDSGGLNLVCNDRCSSMPFII